MTETAPNDGDLLDELGYVLEPFTLGYAPAAAQAVLDATDTMAIGLHAALNAIEPWAGRDEDAARSVIATVARFHHERAARPALAASR